MKLHRPETSLALVAALLAFVACGESITQPQMEADPPPLLGSVANAATTTLVDFTMGPFVLTALGDTKFPGTSGRLHIKDWLYLGPVSGDLGDGNAVLVTSVRFNGSFSGPANGTLEITTPSGVWSGGFTAELIGLQSFLSNVVLHGPMQQKVHATCSETTPNSEILTCSGEVLSPHD
jgi:hypothetical protein